MSGRGNSISNPSMSEKNPHIEPTLTPSGSLAPAYFHTLYAEQDDPWEFEKSPYEAAKYKATLAALPRAHYHQALEIGCSIGVLTEKLAPRCQRLLALDVSEAAISQARTRCREFSQVRFEQRHLPQEFPLAERFDLILLSEVGYYFSITDLSVLRARIAATLAPHGHLLLVHFTGPTNYPLTADAVHDFFLAWEGIGWSSLHQARAEGYRLDLVEAKSKES